MSNPDSSNAFVVLPPLSDHGVIFGKNSDRPQGEVQEIVYFPSDESAHTRKCTYVEVELSGPSKAVILSKPYWMWGAEMGANECGVVIGNVPVLTNNCEGDHDPQVQRLLGTDLVRLGLERSSSASEAVDVITQLLDQYGQGGSCFKDTNFCAHNSFLIADSKCAWVLETIGKHWAAEQVTSRYLLSICTNTFYHCL
uniref:Dipeptidase n=1 Tax=Photinus pyralis TaxID=7054 RepID=A0A1Y1KD81_PHOPY